jgi:hypothetical protein
VNGGMVLMNHQAPCCRLCYCEGAVVKLVWLGAAHQQTELPLTLRLLPVHRHVLLVVRCNRIQLDVIGRGCDCKAGVLQSRDNG